MLRWSRSAPISVSSSNSFTTNYKTNMSSPIPSVRQKTDQVIADIVDYAMQYKITSAEAYNTARLCLMDTLGCGFEALEYPACPKVLRPLVPGTGRRHADRG